MQLTDHLLVGKAGVVALAALVGVAALEGKVALAAVAALEGKVAEVEMAMEGRAEHSHTCHIHKEL